MPALLLYLLKANVALALFYLAYHFVLRRITFYTLNRVFLLFGLLFSFLYPFLDLSVFFEQHEPLAIVHSYAIAMPATWQAAPTTTPETQAFDYWLIPIGLVLAGAFVVAIRLLMQFISLYKIHIRSEPAAYKSIGYRKVQSIKHAFSFWQSIYLNPEQHRQQELDAILNHELVHVKGWHTLDVLLAEFCTLLSWFNPGGWLMKKAIKENLEFIADQNVLTAGVDRKDYQYLLLKVTGISEPQIANQFNFSPLKTRIAMMNKMPSTKANQLKLLIVLPLVTVLLFAFRSASSSSELVANAEQAATQTTLQDGGKDIPKELKEYLERHPAIKNARMKVIDNRNSLVVHLRKGGTEVYYLDDANSIAALESKYGKLPELPPPPAPVAHDAENLPAPPPPVPSAVVYYIDGVKSTENASKQLNPNDIHSVNVLKGEGVKKLLGDASQAKDIISITTREKQNSPEVITFNKKISAELPVQPRVQVKVNQQDELPTPPPPKPQDKSEPFIFILDEVDYYKNQANWPADYKDFLKRNPNVEKVGWISDRIDWNLESIVIYLKSDKTDVYDYGKNPVIPAAEAKYGQLPQLPPPPPPVRSFQN
ncbi:M56 family metallopeptidase [Pontibacter sp. MBLB2868]|uniref:M56 family metallopeptidase n=1 Tax=Pontibacter sp. MBLB2868 TaxID=3451555 RepID=UPI003F74E5D4